MRTLRTSVRRLVEFLLRSGDIDSGEGRRGDVEAMMAGSAIHRTLQAAGGDAYQAEVPLAGSFFFPAGRFSPHAARLDIHEEMVGDQEGFFLRVEGRADGIIDDGAHPLVIDEIKGVARDVSAIEEPVAIHEAQALCYAYLHLRRTRGPSALASAYGERVVVRLTYASMTTGEVRQIERTHSAPDIEAWFFSLLEAAQRWAAWRVEHEEKRERSLAALVFPLRPRDGQGEIMDAVATAIREGKRLYLQAPTGSGKTIATLYPAIKALGSGRASRIAFLTAKSMTRRPALECLDLLRRQGITLSVLVMTARDKICPLRSDERVRRGAQVRTRPFASLCNPVECPLARGHYDAANDALYEAIASHEVLDSDHVGSVAARWHVCPYELERDATRWADVIVCDYHYAFSPSASLFGLADEPGGSGTIYLVDEAHNLVERMRDSHSAELDLAEFEDLERLLRTHAGLGELAKAVRSVIQAFPMWKKALPESARDAARGRRGAPTYQAVHVGDAFVRPLTALADGIDATMEWLLPKAGDAEAGGRGRGASSGTIEAFCALRDTGFRLRAFLGALRRSEVGYVAFLDGTAGRGRRLKFLCVDPSHDLEERLGQACAAVFFSGTLLPLDYHRRLLAARDDDATLYARSGFDRRNQQVLVGADVSARYARRGPELYDRIATYLVALVRERPGNHIAFLPSYALLEEISKVLGPRRDPRTEVVRQRPGMPEREREDFVAAFRKARPEGTSLLGLCVLGGVFGESIDLPGEALVGVVVVGTGMPRASGEREVIRDYFDARGDRGFAYAYTYPGMNKVLQAAGRLIRTEEDRGVVLLLDDRFLGDELREAFPREWDDVRTCTLETLPALLAQG